MGFLIISCEILPRINHINLSKFKSMKYIIYLSLFLTITGCSTIYTITSEPSGAEVFVRNRAQGITPTTVKFSNSFGKSSPINLRLDRYKPIHVIAGSDDQSFHFDLKPLTPLAIEAPEIKEPNTFVRTLEPGWASIQLREKMSYSSAWNNVLDIFVKKFDIAIMQKESGYIRTNWTHTSTGILRGDYRVRVTAKFNVSRTKVDIKTEASYQLENGWVQGSDTALLQTLKADIMGAVGRVTR